jgi:uncharacterized protein DUF4167
LIYRKALGAQPSVRTNSSTRQRQNGSAGNAHRNYERYVALGREASLNGDKVEAENYYQHAEYYFRVMRERST